MITVAISTLSEDEKHVTVECWVIGPKTAELFRKQWGTPDFEELQDTQEAAAALRTIKSRISVDNRPQD